MAIVFEEEDENIPTSTPTVNNKINFIDEEALTPTQNVGATASENISNEYKWEPGGDKTHIVSESAPFVSGVMGSLRGGATGLRLGGPTGALVGGVIGGAIGSGGGRYLGDSLNEYLELDKKPMKEKLRRAGVEAGTSLGIDIATFGIGSALKPTLLKGVKKLSNDVRKARLLDKIGKKVDLSKRKLKNELTEIGLKISATKERIKMTTELEKDMLINNEVKGLKKKNELKSKSIKKGLDNISKIINKESTFVTKRLADASNKSLKGLGLEYDKLEKVYGSEPISLLEPLEELTTLSKSKDPLIFQDMTPINSTISKINEKVKRKGKQIISSDFTVKDAIALRRTMSNQIRKLYNRGGEASGALADNLSSILTKLDNNIDTATEGASSVLNQRYKQTVNLAKANSLFKSDLLKAGNAGLQNIQDIVQIDLNSLMKQAEKQGDSFFKVDPKLMKEAIQNGESVFNLSQKQLLKLTNQSQILRTTGIKELSEFANEIDESLVKLARASISKSAIKENLQNLGINKELINEMTEEITKKIEKDSNLQELIFKQEDLKSQIFLKDKMSTRIVEKKGKLETQQNISSNLLGLFIAGNTIKEVLTFSGLPRLGGAAMSAVNLTALAKWSPIAADTIEPAIKEFSNVLTSAPTPKKETTKQIIQHLIQYMNLVESNQLNEEVINNPINTNTEQKQ